MLRQHVGMTGLNMFVEIILPCDGVFTIGAFKFQAFVNGLYVYLKVIFLSECGSTMRAW